jgi:hypothetical protein
MFNEIDPSIMKPAEDLVKKRWFRDSDAECDLFVWVDEQGQLKRFQFWHHDALVEWDKLNGLKTGHVDRDSGAFIHYQTTTYKFHQHFDEEIITIVSEILTHEKLGENESLNDVKNILNEITNRRF